jgi:hypothetical protein
MEECWVHEVLDENDERYPVIMEQFASTKKGFDTPPRDHLDA